MCCQLHHGVASASGGENTSAQPLVERAGGILKASNLKVGARLIRIRRNGEAQANAFTLPVKGLNVPDENVKLIGGETIEVERFEPDLFTVVGLVTKPGAY